MVKAKRHWLSGSLLFVFASAASATQPGVENARVRLLPGDLPAAGYFRLTNAGDQPVVLVGAESPAFGRLMMHRSTSQDGMAGMKHVPQLAVKPGETVEFAPGGYHLMLMERQKPLAVGDEIDITLLVEDGRRLPVAFKAVPPAVQ